MTTLTVLRNEAYLGQVNFRDKVYPATHPPLIEESTFRAAQALLTERGENYSRRRSNSKSRFANRGGGLQSVCLWLAAFLSVA